MIINFTIIKAILVIALMILISSFFMAGFFVLDHLAVLFGGVVFLGFVIVFMIQNNLLLATENNGEIEVIDYALCLASTERVNIFIEKEGLHCRLQKPLTFKDYIKNKCSLIVNGTNNSLYIKPILYGNPNQDRKYFNKLQENGDLDLITIDPGTFIFNYRKITKACPPDKITKYTVVYGGTKLYIEYFLTW